MGYLPFDRPAVNFLFQLAGRRYERGSIILTSNKTYGEWGDIFSDQVLAAAILDRLLHHSVTISIHGESYRLKDKTEGRSLPDGGGESRNLDYPGDFTPVISGKDNPLLTVSSRPSRPGHRGSTSD